MRKIYSILAVFFFFLIGCGQLVAKEKFSAKLSAEEALAIVKKTPEVQAFLNYRNGILANCIESKVTRSCDSEWVTCRDDAWVVQFVLTDRCPVKSDGRLSMNFVIDGHTGEIVSHYPEIDYFKDPQFCRDTADCVTGPVHTCLNFVEAPFMSYNLDESETCQCLKNWCRPGPKKI